MEKEKRDEKISFSQVTSHIKKIEEKIYSFSHIEIKYELKIYCLTNKKYITFHPYP